MSLTVTATSDFCSASIAGVSCCHVVKLQLCGGQSFPKAMCKQYEDLQPHNPSNCGAFKNDHVREKRLLLK